MDTDSPPRGPSAALSVDAVRAFRPPPPSKDSGVGSLQITVYRSDYRQTERLDIGFNAGDLLTEAGQRRLRVSAQLALSRLLERMLPFETTVDVVGTSSDE